MQTSELWYSVYNLGDKTAFVRFYLSEELCDIDEVLQKGEFIRTLSGMIRLSAECPVFITGVATKELLNKEAEYKLDLANKRINELKEKINNIDNEK